MADQNFDIAIRILTEQVGPEKAQEILKKVREETAKTGVESQKAGDKTVDANKRSGKALEEHEQKVTGLNKALGMLARVGGETGQKLHNLYQLSGNVLTIGIAAGAVAVSSIISKWQDWKQEIANTKAELEKIEWSKFNSVAEGLKNAVLDLNKLEIAISKAGKSGDDDVKTLFDERMAVIDAEIEKKTSLLKLNEELEVSNARLILGGEKDKEELANVEKQIRARYGSARAGLETSSDRRKLQELQDELALRQGKSPGMRAAAENLQRIASEQKASPLAAEAAAKIALLGGKDGQVEKLLAESKTAQAAADSWSWRDLFSGDDIIVRQRRADQAREKLQERAAELAHWEKVQTTHSMNQQVLDSAATDAFGEFSQNESAVTTLQKQIAKRMRVDPIKAAQRANESMFGLRGNPASEEFLLAVAGAHNIGSGERATPDQANAINRVAQVQGFSSKNVALLLKILDGLFGQQEKLSQALERYERRLQDAQRTMVNMNHRP